MSSGWPRRPAGIPLRNFVFSAGSAVMRFSQTGIDDLRGQDGIHAHAATTPFRAEFARHLRDRAHRHAVGDVAATERSDARERADVHDAPAAPPRASGVRLPDTYRIGQARGFARSAPRRRARFPRVVRAHLRPRRCRENRSAQTRDRAAQTSRGFAPARRRCSSRRGLGIRGCERPWPSPRHRRR